MARSHHQETSEGPPEIRDEVGKFRDTNLDTKLDTTSTPANWNITRIQLLVLLGNFFVRKLLAQ
jgi:hypothetical protein